MPRRLRRAAMLGATAHYAAKKGAAAGAAQAAPQPGYAAPPPTYAAPPPAAVPEPRADTYTELMKLKELLDSGVLTQAEFDVQKQKILSG